MAIRQNAYAHKIRNILQLMIEMQTRPMFIHVICKELQVTERTAYRYLAMFKELGFKLDKNIYGAYTVLQTEPIKQKKRPAKRISNEQRENRNSNT